MGHRATPWAGILSATTVLILFFTCRHNICWAAAATTSVAVSVAASVAAAAGTLWVTPQLLRLKIGTLMKFIYLFCCNSYVGRYMVRMMSINGSICLLYENIVIRGRSECRRRSFVGGEGNWGSTYIRWGEGGQATSLVWAGAQIGGAVCDGPVLWRSPWKRQRSQHRAIPGAQRGGSLWGKESRSWVWWVMRDISWIFLPLINCCCLFICCC